MSDTPETKRERIARLKKQAGISNQRPKSLSIKVQEMERYDWNPAMRYLLLILVLGTRRSKENYSDTWVQDGCPWTAEEMVGWCDFSQWRLAGRVGLTTDHVNRMLSQLEEDGLIEKEMWEDEVAHSKHCRYRVIETTVEANQRPEWSPTMKRGSRYKVKRGANKGSFTKANQPTISDTLKAIREEDGE